jgi:protein-L-isoaspartate(D-aspartate) O-methyltransferase
MNLEQARFNMIEQQIRPWEVLDAHVLHLLSVVKREDFVPQGFRNLAFFDMEIPLAGGQCMLAPRVEARMLQDLALQKHEKVLEVGTGSGYMAALLAHRAQRVISLEINAELALTARANLHAAGVLNAEVRHLDASRGMPVEAPFDVIVLSGSLAEIPPSLLTHLKVGGRLGAIIGDEPMMRATFVTRVGEAQFRTLQPWDTVAPRLQNFPEPSRFSL